MVLCLTISVRLEALLGGRRLDHFESERMFDVDLKRKKRLIRNYRKSTEFVTLSKIFLNCLNKESVRNKI